MHLKRWLTALVLIPLIILVLLKGRRLGFVLTLLLINGLAQWEFLGFFQHTVDQARKVKVVALGSLLILVLHDRKSSGSCSTRVGPRGLPVCLVPFLSAELRSHSEAGLRPGHQYFGTSYIPLLLGHFVWLRYMTQGEWWILWLLFVICCGDTAAYYTGKAIGQRKFYPQVSPGKTWAGTSGELATNLVVGVLLGRWFLPSEKFFSLALLAVVLGCIGLLGDLFESMLKRQAEVKDASSLLPGHGGMLDRLDSLLFTAPALVYARLFIFPM